MGPSSPHPAGYARPQAYRSCGHCKGVVVWESNWMGWLVHSLPQWPCHDTSSPSGLGGGGGGGRGPLLSPVQDKQTVKGQSFMWVVLPRAQLPTVVRQLQHMQVSERKRGGGLVLRGIQELQPMRSILLLTASPALPCTAAGISPLQALVYFRSDPSVWPWEPTDYTRYPGPAGMREVALARGLWHVAKPGPLAASAAKGGDDGSELNFYHALAQRWGGRWLVRTNLAQNGGEAGKCASDAVVANISRLAVPGLDHKPYLGGSEHAKMAVCVGLRRDTGGWMGRGAVFVWMRLYVLYASLPTTSISVGRCRLLLLLLLRGPLLCVLPPVPLPLDPPCCRCAPRTFGAGGRPKQHAGAVEARRRRPAGAARLPAPPAAGHGGGGGRSLIVLFRSHLLLF